MGSGLRCTLDASSRTLAPFNFLGELCEETHSHIRPSSTGSRSFVHATFSDVSTDSVLYSVSANKVFYLTAYGMSFLNTATTDKGRVILRDVPGGTSTPKFPLIIPQAVAGAMMGEVALASNLTEPMRFNSTVSMSVLSGTVTGSGFFIGYEE